MRSVLEAALRFAPPEVRGELFEQLELACEQAFKTVFPLYRACGRWLDPPQLPETPLADEEQRLKRRRAPAIGDNPDAMAKFLAKLPAPQAKSDRSDEPPNPARPSLGGSPSLSEKAAHVDESLRDSRPMAKPSTQRNRHTPRDERLPWQYAQRVARTTSAILPRLDDKNESVVLSPKRTSRQNARATITGPQLPRRIPSHAPTP